MKKNHILSLSPRGLALAAALATLAPPAVAQQDCMLGELRLFAGNFAPLNWMLAQGQILSLNGQTAQLFAILGATYGGNGSSTFALPDLRGRVAAGAGQGPGLSYRSLGQQWGAETRTLTTSELPAHIHPLNVASNAPATTGTPGGDKVLAVAQNAGLYAAAPPSVALAGNSLATAGSGQPFSILPPSLGMNYIICTGGTAPVRP